MNAPPLALPLAFALALASALAGGLPAQRDKDNHVVVFNDGVEEAYARAIETLVETAWQGYVEDLGMPMPKMISVHLDLAEENELRLYTDGQADVFLTVSSMRQLQPSPRSGVFNLYGFCHELGHIAMYHRLKTVSGLNSGVAEAWAHVCGSIVCDFVFDREGRKLWPVPFDYKRLEGTARLRKSVKKRPKSPSDYDLAVKGFWSIYLMLGKKRFFQAADLCLKEKPGGSDFLPRFLDAVKKVSKKRRLPEFFPAKLLRQVFSWKPGPPDLEDASLFTAQRSVKEKKGKGFTVQYGPEDPDPKSYRSIGGTGYFQLFQNPHGEVGKLQKVELFGYRYGSRQSDDAEVAIWICDASMQILHEHKIKYRDLNWGREAVWFEVPAWKSCKVPGHFLVGVFFDPTATKGYFMGYHETGKSHSYTGTPSTGLSLLKGQDWIIRLRIAKK